MSPIHCSLHQSRWLSAALQLALALFSAVTFAAGNPAPRSAVPEIEYGYPEQSIFVASTNAKGQPDSPMTRLAEVLMERVGIPMRAVPYPASRMFNHLKDGTTQFAILVKAPALEECCLLSQQPVYSTHLNVYYVGNKASVKSKDDLVGKKVITIRGYSYGGLLKFITDPANNIANESAGTHKAGFDMLRAGRADYLIDYASAANGILAESPIDQLHSNAIDKLDIYIVLAKSYPEADKLMARLEEIVKTLNVDEVLRGIKPRR
jgi:polar amino acid transport system substrate-binding protein